MEVDGVREVRRVSGRPGAEGAEGAVFGVVEARRVVRFVVEAA